MTTMGAGSRADRRRTAWLAMLMVSTGLATGGFGVPAMAQQAQPHADQTAQATRTFKIPAQSLTGGLTAFGQQSGWQVSVHGDLIRGASTRGVSGTMTPQQALDRLLAGTGFAYAISDGNTVTLQKLPRTSEVAPGTIQLAPVRVEGQSAPGNPATTEGIDSYGSPAATVAGKVPLGLKEIPQSVSVVTQQRIQDQNLATLDQALAQTTGVVVQQGDSDRPYYYARGFQIDTIQMDGVPTTISNPTSAQNLAMYDRVGVLRGPAGLLSGLGSPAGTINLVRKLPTANFQMSDEFNVGSYLNFRDQFDVAGPLNAAGTVRGRFVTSLQTQNFAEDSTYRRDAQFYGVVEGDVAPDTTVRAGASYQTVPQRAGWVGVPVYSNYQPVDAPRSTFYGASWNKDVYSETTAFGEIEHHFDNGWLAKGTLNYVDYQSSIVNDNISGFADPATNTATIVADKWKQNDQQTALDAYAAGPFSLFGRTHTAMVGFTASHEHFDQQNYYCPADNLFCSQTANIFDLNIPEPAFNGPVNEDVTDTYQYGLYGNVHLKLAAPLTLVLGGRVLWWDNAYKPNPDENFFGDARTHDRIDAQPIPFAGLIYDVNKTYSLYVGYSDIFEPQTTRDITGKLLKPIEGDQYEVGVKSSYFDGRLNASLAAFQITQQNRAMQDPNDPTGTIFFAQGKARSRGFEAEVSGKITDDWDIFAGYTYTETKNYDDSFNTDNGVAFSSVAPKHLVKLWTTYRLPGDSRKWTVGGGVVASSKFYNQDSGGQLVAGGYATVGLRVGYQANEHISAAINVDNLTDARYLYSVNGTQNGFLGAPRTVLFSLRSTW